MTQQFTVFFDGDCPLCQREINWLRKRTGDRVHYQDISPKVSTDKELPLPRAELMSKIYGKKDDGTLISGVEVFRQLYSAAGFGPLVFMTRLPIIAQLLGLGYSVFARFRLTLTGRKACQGSCAL